MTHQNTDVCDALISYTDVKSALLAFTRDHNPNLKFMASSVLTNMNRMISKETENLSLREQKHILQVLVKLLDDGSVQSRVPSVIEALTEYKCPLLRLGVVWRID